jgi:hypothetical protein
VHVQLGSLCSTTSNELASHYYSEAIETLQKQSTGQQARSKRDEEFLRAAYLGRAMAGARLVYGVRIEQSTRQRVEKDITDALELSDVSSEYVFFHAAIVYATLAEGLPKETDKSDAPHRLRYEKNGVRELNRAVRIWETQTPREQILQWEVLLANRVVDFAFRAHPDYNAKVIPWMKKAKKMAENDPEWLKKQRVVPAGRSGGRGAKGK